MDFKSNNVYVNEAIHILQVSEDDFDSLIKSHSIKLIADEMGPSISKNDYQVLAHSSELKILVQKALGAQSIQRERDEARGLNKHFSEDSSNKLIRYRAYVKTIEAIHAKYNDIMEPATSETPESAAYILLARSISLTRMAIDSLGDHHFEAMLLLRPIDEAIALAEYFLIEKDTEIGKKDLASWFRENISPTNSTCRKSIDRYWTSFPGSTDAPSMGSLMNRIYQAKSKPVHNAHHSIMETYNTRLTKDGLLGLGFDYGQSSYPRKLNELISFYQSSIWSLVQAMMFCFAALTKILSQQDVDALNGLNISFGREMQERGG